MKNKRIELWLAVSVKEEGKASGGSTTTHFELPVTTSLVVNLDEIAEVVEKFLTKSACDQSVKQ